MNLCAITIASLIDLRPLLILFAFPFLPTGGLFRISKPGHPSAVGYGGGIEYRGTFACTTRQYDEYREILLPMMTCCNTTEVHLVL